MFRWLSNHSLSLEDRVKVACAIYNRNDQSKVLLPKWLSEEIIFLHNGKQERQPTLAPLWRLLAACLQERQQPLLNYLPLIHVARDEIVSGSGAVDDIILCLHHFPDALFRRLDVLIELLRPLIECALSGVDSDQYQLLLELLGKYLYCHRNHGNQKKVFKQFCDNLLWPCLQLRCLCARLGAHGDLLISVDKLLGSLFHRSHLVEYDSGLASLTASSSYTRHLFESLATSITDCKDNEIIASGLPYLFRSFLEHSRQASNTVKRNTEFQFFKWTLSQLGISEDKSGVVLADGAHVDVIHKCLCILLEFDVVEPSHDKSTGGLQLDWLGMLARCLVDISHDLIPEVVNCLSILVAIYHLTVEPLLPALLCQLAHLADHEFIKKLISLYAKLRQLKEFLYMHLESIESTHGLTLAAAYSYPVSIHLANHLKHLPTGQVTQIIEMFCSHLQANLPSSESSDPDLPKRKKRRLQKKPQGFYQAVDLFCLVLDHVPLVGIDIAKLIHQQLYCDILLPLLKRLPCLHSSTVHCSLHLNVSCTRILGYAKLLTDEVLSLVDVHSISQGSSKLITDGPSLLLLKQLVSLHVRFATIEEDNFSESLSFVLQVPTVCQSLWDGQWLNVRPDNLMVANWKLITTELPHVYSWCSEGHLQGVAKVIVNALTLQEDLADGVGLHFVSITDDLVTSCAFQEMSLLHTQLLKCMFEKAKLFSHELPKPFRKTLSSFCKLFTKFNEAEMSSRLTSVLCVSDCDVHQLELWTNNTLSVIKILKYLPLSRMPADHLALCIALVIVWLFMVSKNAFCQEIKYTLLLAWLFRCIREHPQRKRHLVSFPFFEVQEWLCSLLLCEDSIRAVVWPACKALLECAASCDLSVMKPVIKSCTQSLPEHVINSHAFNVISDIANTSLDTVLKGTNYKQALPEELCSEISQFYHVIQRVIRKACKKSFVSLLSSTSLMSSYVAATPFVPEDIVDVSTLNGLLVATQQILQTDIAVGNDDDLTVNKMYCSMVEVLKLVLLRDHPVMAVWQTGSQLWQSLLSTIASPVSHQPHGKLCDVMKRVMVKCSNDDVEVIFESLLTEEISSHLLFTRQWQLILNNKMPVETRKVLNRYLSRLICKCMELLAVSKSADVLHGVVSLVAKLLTMCHERDTRSVMLTFHSCLFSHQRLHCLNCMSLSIAVLSAMLRYHLNTAISCASVLFAALGKLLVAIIQVAQSSQPDYSVDEIVTIANNLCRVIELVSAEAKFTKYVPHLIAAYLIHAGGEQGGEITDTVKESLLSGVYLLLRLCTEHETSFLNATLDECSRQLFQVILSDYQKLHKYRGKV